MATNIEYLHADQIGGCVTLISTETTKICIDFGKNLPGSRYKDDVEVVGLTSGEAQYDAVFFTHYHGDHIGCFEKLLPEIPLYMSSLCRDVLINTYAALARHDNAYGKQVELLQDAAHTHIIWAQDVIKVGDIKVTPYTIDHSATAAMMYLIETPDKRILHMGDFRTHGYIGDKLKKLLKSYVLKKPVDATAMSAGNTAKEKLAQVETGGLTLTEEELAQQAGELMQQHKLIFCLCASTNFTRLQNFYRMAINEHKVVLLNGYMLAQFKSYYKYKQELCNRLYHKRSENPWQPYKMYTLLLDKDYLHDDSTYQIQDRHLQEHGAVIFVSGMMAVATIKKLWEKYKELQPLIIYSQWQGYIKDKGAEYYKEDLARLCTQYPTVQLHTSGHASKKVIEEIIRLVDAQEYTAVIHSERAELIDRSSFG